MAKLGRPKKRGRKKIYTEAFGRIYKRYVKMYRQKERILGKRGFEMRDPHMFRKSEFKDYYKAYEREKATTGEKFDITKTIVNQQAYEHSHSQYIGFKQALKEDEYLAMTTGLDYTKINEVKFRKGEYFNKDFWDAYKQAYHDRKQQLEEEGFSERESWKQADYEMRNLYFGSP